jgi:4-amino-4-deoxy-L-arabinose transferase-like glycosyltransferase
MLLAHNWLVPTYEGQPFFDKPVLFHWLQMVSFSMLGTTEFAARLVPALAGLALLGCTAWLGAQLFSIEIGESGALMLAVLPATFALSAYAILDMLFTTFIFGGAALLTVAALKDRWRLQYPAYGLIALAILTKGPVALALLALAF